MGQVADRGSQVGLERERRLPGWRLPRLDLGCGRCLGRHRRWGRGGGVTRGPESSQQGTHREAVAAGLDEELGHHPVLPRLDLDQALVGLHLGHHVALVHLVAWLHEPGDQHSLVHVRPERGEPELDHRPTIRWAVATIRSGWGRAASSM